MSEGKLILKNMRTKEVRGSSPARRRISAFSVPWVEKGKSGGENHDKRALDEGVDNGANQLNKRTHD